MENLIAREYTIRWEMYGNGWRVMHPRSMGLKATLTIRISQPRALMGNIVKFWEDPLLALGMKPLIFLDFTLEVISSSMPVSE